MESPLASSSSQTPVAASETDSLAKDLQNQNLEAVDEGGAKIKRKLEDFNWDHSFVKELPGDPRSDVTSRESLYPIQSLITCGSSAASAPTSTALASSRQQSSATRNASLGFSPTPFFR
ncbi:unnamed protein product [Brassica rapa]|uniref:Uncharacterized protein n=1 Tax=Brassica campestris TaxID=3711 RepID=A0A8D9GSX5_BRACM|nr:unnamed protein product [Brassica rapa]